jgi:hypothetical protein
MSEYIEQKNLTCSYLKKLTKFKQNNMKNLFIILITLFTSLNSNAISLDSTLKQTTDVITQLDTSSNFKAIVGNTQEAVKYLAVGLKTTAENVWDILVKQQKVKSWTYLLLFLFAIIVDVLIIKVIKQTFAYVDDKENPGPYVLSVFLIIAGAVFSVYNSSNLYPMLTGFINPEYGALKDIVEIAQQFK